MKKILHNVLFIVAFLFIWWLASTIANKSVIFPTPYATFEMLVNFVETGVFFKHLGASFLRVTTGVVIAALISVPLGMAIAWFKPVETLFKPLVDSFKYLPPTGFSPILILILGLGEEMKVTFIAIAALFSFLPTVIQACSEPIDELKETAYTMGFSYPRMLWYCFIPYITPQLLQSFINLYGVGWTYVVIAEVNNTRYGLGHLMYIGSARGKMAMVFAAMVIIAVAGWIFNKLSMEIVKRVFKWRFEDEK